YMFHPFYYEAWRSSFIPKLYSSGVVRPLVSATPFGNTSSTSICAPMKRPSSRSEDIRSNDIDLTTTVSSSS
ncbi:hypothetical protein AB6A40_005373, partial [Gnathostoma spinigerum]